MKSILEYIERPTISYVLELIKLISIHINLTKHL